MFRLCGGRPGPAAPEACDVSKQQLTSIASTHRSETLQFVHRFVHSCLLSGAVIIDRDRYCLRKAALVRASLSARASYSVQRALQRAIIEPCCLGYMK